MYSLTSDSALIRFLAYRLNRQDKEIVLNCILRDVTSPSLLPQKVTVFPYDNEEEVTYSNFLLFRRLASIIPLKDQLNLCEKYFGPFLTQEVSSYHLSWEAEQRLGLYTPRV